MRELLWSYLGRSSGLIVNLAVLPMYSRSMKPADFGAVALVLSLLAMLSLLDLGTTQRISHGLADTTRPVQARLLLLRTAERTLCLAGLTLSLPLLAIAAITIGASILPAVMLALSLLLAQWLLTVQTTALQALRAQKSAALLSAGGLTARAVLTLCALLFIRAELEVFLFAYLIATIALSWISGRLIRRRLPERDHPAPRPRWRDCLVYLHESRALIWAGLVGAIATQADKTLISSLVSPADLAPYFLATTLATAPLSIMGAPLVQYLQPILSGQLARRELAQYRQSCRFGLAAACLLVVAPCVALGLLANEVCRLWLGDAASTATIASYCRILLVGYAIAATGYIPFAMVMAHGDFGFQARWATGAMVLQLLGVTAAAWCHRIDLVCWTTVVYYAFSTIGLGMRSHMLARRFAS